MKRHVALGLWLILALGVGLGLGLARGQEKTSIAANSPSVLAPVALNEVKVGGEVGRRIEATVQNNLLKIDVDKDFLAPFHARNQKGGYIGLGKLIDSLVLLSVHTGDPALLSLKDRVVREVISTQEGDGYIGLMEPSSRMWKLWDVHEMSYLVYGLLSNYRHYKDTASLEAARKLGDYVVRRWLAEPQGDPSEGTIELHMAVTGLEQAMLALHEATNDARYLDFVRQTRRLPEWEAPIVLGRWGKVGGHAYAHMCRCLAQVRLYGIEPEARLLEPTERVIEFITKRDGMLVTGEVSDHECWHDTQEGLVDLGETCSTAYLIRLLDARLRLTGDAVCGDLMERAIFNALFAAQSPDGRKLRYYTPMDGPRKYFDGDTYCCPCNYRRIVGELPRMIYYTEDKGVLVNLYTASSARIALKEGLEVKIEQETEYPRQGAVRLRVSPSEPADFGIRLRIPRWCQSAKVQLNGKELEGEVRPGEFLEVKRTWQEGDTVDLDFPMEARLVQGRKAQAGRVAVMRGPLVYCVSRTAAEGLEGLDLRLLVIDPTKISQVEADDSAIPGGTCLRVKAWKADSWYPMAGYDFELRLREFADPAGEATYFKVPDPGAKEIVKDELLGGHEARALTR